MSDESRPVKVVTDPGLLLGAVWVPKDGTALVERTRAEQLVKDGHCARFDSLEVDFPDLYPKQTAEELEAIRLADEARRNQPASQLIEWPAYMKLNAGGLTDSDQLKTYIAENGTLWAKRLDLTDEEIIAVETKLKELDGKPAAKAKAKKAE